VKLGTSNLVGWFAIACPSLSVTNRAKKGRGQGYVTNYRILHPIKYIRNGEFVHGLATRSTNLQMTICPLIGCGQGHLTHSIISHALKYLWNA